MITDTLRMDKCGPGEMRHAVKRNILSFMQKFCNGGDKDEDASKVYSL